MFKPEGGKGNGIILVHLMGEPNSLQPLCFLNQWVSIEVLVVVPDKTILKGRDINYQAEEYN